MPEFIRTSKKLMTDEEVMDALAAIASDPEHGEVMVGTGGARKTRSKLEGRGKSGGARIVYAYFGEDVPVFVLTCFPKNAKANLSEAEKRMLKKVLSQLEKEYRDGLGKRTSKGDGKHGAKKTGN